MARCLSGPTVCLFIAVVIFNTGIFAPSWFLTTIKLRPWQLPKQAEQGNRVWDVIFWPAFVVSIITGCINFSFERNAAALRYRDDNPEIYYGYDPEIELHYMGQRERTWLRRAQRNGERNREKGKLYVSGWAYYCLALLGLIGSLAFALGPFLTIAALPLGSREQYFKNICSNFDTRIGLDSHGMGDLTQRPYTILRDRKMSHFKYPLKYSIGDNISTVYTDLSTSDLSELREYEASVVCAGKDEEAKKDCKQDGSKIELFTSDNRLPYSKIEYDWTNQTCRTVSSDRSIVKFGTWLQRDEDLYLPSLALQIPDYTRITHNSVYDPYLRVFRASTSIRSGVIDLTKLDEQRNQAFRNNDNVLARMVSFGAWRGDVEVCTQRRLRFYGRGSGRMTEVGLGEDLEVVVWSLQSVRLHEWMFGGRVFMETAVFAL